MESRTWEVGVFSGSSAVLAAEQYVVVCFFLTQHVLRSQ